MKQRLIELREAGASGIRRSRRDDPRQWRRATRSCKAYIADVGHNVIPEVLFWEITADVFCIFVS